MFISFTLFLKGNSLMLQIIPRREYTVSWFIMLPAFTSGEFIYYNGGGLHCGVVEDRIIKNNFTVVKSHMTTLMLHVQMSSILNYSHSTFLKV